MDLLRRTQELETQKVVLLWKNGAVLAALPLTRRVSF